MLTIISKHYKRLKILSLLDRFSKESKEKIDRNYFTETEVLDMRVFKAFFPLLTCNPLNLEILEYYTLYKPQHNLIIII